MDSSFTKRSVTAVTRGRKGRSTTITASRSAATAKKATLLGVVAGGAVVSVVETTIQKKLGFLLVKAAFPDAVQDRVIPRAAA
jgi:hypothetical protein